jgi:drug/metabolite transporter (DMT)-like permease
MTSLEASLAARPVDRRKGLSIALLGGMAISLDIPMVRLTDGDMWSVQFLRSFNVVTVTLAVWLAAKLIFNKRIELVPGRLGLPVIAIYGVSTLLFFYAVYATTTANLVFILAFNPMFGALFGWLILNEKPRAPTFLAMAVMAAGVFIIVQEGLSGGHLLGDLAALTAAMTIAVAVTLSRLSGRDMGFAALISAIVPASIAGMLVFNQGGLHMAAPGWTMLNGLALVPTAFYCLALAPVYISGPTVGMFYLLETIFAPVWVWMIFKEVPSAQTMIGGGILLSALIAHSVWELAEESRARTAG